MTIRAITFIVAVLALAGSSVAQSGRQAITPERRFNTVNRPVPLRIDMPPVSAGRTLVLMNHHGTALLEPVDIPAEAFDLATLMPDLWSIRETAFLQAFVGTEPIGSSLVLQPMLTRMVPITERATRNERAYTRIAGFRSELAQEGDEGDVPDPVFTGFRIYPERDVMFETTHGDIRLAMRPDAAPNTVWNFLELSSGGFYDDTIVHRIVPVDREGRPFVIQGGDPSAHGEGGPGYWLPIENSELPHDIGVISMARSDDPDSAGSQWFICLSREGTARLDGQYCAFGEAVDGLETILAIANEPLADVAKGRPQTPPVVQRARLVPAPSRLLDRGRPDTPLATQAAQAREAEEANREPEPDRVPR